MSKHFKWLDSLLSGVIVDRHKKTGEPLVNPKTVATEEDWIAIACLSIWSKQLKLTEFWLFSVAMLHMAARGKHFLVFPIRHTWKH